MNISRKPSTISNLETTTDEITNDISNIRSIEATSLDTNTRGFMESRFGYDFSKVRIHADGEPQSQHIQLTRWHTPLEMTLYLKRDNINQTVLMEEAY